MPVEETVKQYGGLIIRVGAAIALSLFLALVTGAFGWGFVELDKARKQIDRNTTSIEASHKGERWTKADAQRSIDKLHGMIRRLENLHLKE